MSVSVALALFAACAAPNSRARNAASAAENASDSDRRADDLAAVTQGEPNVVAIKSRLVSFDNSVPPPPLPEADAAPDDAFRSSLRFLDWLYAHHPDPALAKSVLVRNLSGWQRVTSELEWLRDHDYRQYRSTNAATRVRVEHQEYGPRVFATLRGTTNIVDRDGHVVVSVAHPPQAEVLAHLSDYNGRWQFADITELSTKSAVEQATFASSRSSYANNGGGTIGTGPGGAQLEVGLIVAIDGQPGVPASSSSAHRPFRIIAIPAHDTNNPLAGMCPSATGFNGFGWIFTIITINVSTGATISTVVQCIPLPGPIAAGLPAAPPQPPTIGAIWDAVAIAPPTLGISPADEGVTGLPTWMWSQSADTAAIAVTIDGWTVTGVATRTSFRFDTGDASPSLHATGGSPDQPAATHVYETKGVRTVSTASTWTATVTMTGPGVAPQPTDIGTATLSVSAPYRVVEVRASLTR